VARLDRHLKNKKNQSNQFAKLEIIKKSNLSTENVHLQNSNSRSKRFTFRGKKIDSKSRSQPNLADTETIGDDDEDSHILDLINQTQQIQEHFMSNEKKESSDCIINKDRYEKTSNSSNNLSIINGAEVTRRVRGHKRSNSSVNANDIRKSQEIQETIRNSLICDSREDLSKISNSKDDKTQTTGNEIRVPMSPKELFSHEKGIITRKQSFDVTADMLSSSNEDKTIDVTKFIETSTTIHTPPRTRRDSGELDRKLSLDVFDLTEVG